MKYVAFALLIFVCGCAPNYAGRYLRENPNTPPDIVACIQKEQIKTGMTKAQVKASWGEPRRVDNTHYAGVDMDTWVYQSAWDRYGHNANYLYFKDGRLTGWSD